MIRRTKSASQLIALGACALMTLATAACSKETPPTQAEEQKAEAETNSKTETATHTEKSTDPHAAFARVEIDDVAQLLDSKKAVPVDANSEETRQEMGTLPGAVLLSNPRTFAASELPDDKSTELVFYCGSEKCTSAPKAAARAKEAGYTDVKVMPAGIRGWVKAGKPVEKS